MLMCSRIFLFSENGSFRRYAPAHNGQRASSPFRSSSPVPKTWRKLARRCASLSSAIGTFRNAASTPCAMVGSDDVDLGLGEAVKVGHRLRRPLGRADRRGGCRGGLGQRCIQIGLGRLPRGVETPPFAAAVVGLDGRLDGGDAPNMRWRPPGAPPRRGRAPARRTGAGGAAAGRAATTLGVPGTALAS